MEFPQDIQNIINEYAKPITRPDWRKGCYFSRYSHPYFETYQELITQSVYDFNYDTIYSETSDDDDSSYSAFSDYEEYENHL